MVVSGCVPQACHPHATRPHPHPQASPTNPSTNHASTNPLLSLPHSLTHPQADREVKGLEGVSTIGIHHIDRVVEVVEETLKGHTVQFLATDKVGRE